MREDFTLCVSRLLLAALFLHEGAFLAMNFASSAGAMEKLGVPAPLLAATAALQLAAGLAVALGWQTRLGAAALGLFCLATAVLFHTNFAVRNELLHFEKDLAVAGGLFALVIRGAGSWSVDGLLRATRPVSPPESVR